MTDKDVGHRPEDRALDFSSLKHKVKGWFGNKPGQGQNPSLTGSHTGHHPSPQTGSHPHIDSHTNSHTKSHSHPHTESHINQSHISHEHPQDAAADKVDLKKSMAFVK